MANPAQQELAPTQTTKPTTSTALVPEVVGKGIYTDLPALLVAFDKLRDKYNVCFPIMKPDIIPQLHAVAVRQIAIDARVDREGKPIGADIYRDKGQYRLTKIALDKIAAAGGISWHPAYTGRVDDESQPHYCRYRACAVVMGLDGKERMETDHKGLDLRDGASHGMQPKELEQARKHIEAHTESRAKNRVVRRFAFIKGGYSIEELQRPFIIAALVFTGETSDPELKREVVRVMVQRATGATSALYGPAPTPQLIDDAGRRTAPPPVGAGADDGDDAPSGDSTASADEGPGGPRRFISNVLEVTFEKGVTGGKPWKLNKVKFEDCEATTFSNTKAGIAADAKDNEHPVAVEVKPTDFGLELVSIAFVDPGQEG